MQIFYVFIIIIFSLNIIMSAVNNNYSSVAGWSMALMYSILYNYKI